MDARTKYPEIFAALAAPFRDVRTYSAGGRSLDYITARQAMNRLDEVLGPENWWDEYHEVCDVLFCKLTVRFPDGSTVTKSGSGGFKEMTTKQGGKQVRDEENTDKTGESDAFKRAAVKFGVARYLYKDGVPDFARQSPPTRDGAAKPSGPKAPARKGDAPGPTLVEWAANMVARANEWYGREVKDDRIILCENEWQLINHLARKARDAGWISYPDKTDVRTKVQLLGGLDDDLRKKVVGVARDYLYSELPADLAVGASAPSRREPGQEG